MQIIKYVIATFLMLLISINLFLIFKSDDTDKDIILVKQGDITEKVTAVGTIVPKLSFTVKSPISGTVVKLFHGDGDYVKQNETLLQIKADPAPEDYAKAKQQVEIDWAKEQKYAADIVRYESLLKKGIISYNYQEYNNAKSEYAQARLARSLDEEKLALLEKGQAVVGGRVIANIVVSPSNGYILKCNVSVGDSVVAQNLYQEGNELFTISDMGSLIFKGEVSETDIAKLHLNMPATIKIAAFPDVPISGLLTKLRLQSTQATQNKTNAANNQGAGTSPSASPFNVGFEIEIGNFTLPKGIKLRSGFSATADIVVKQVKKVLVIPVRALQFEDEKPYVLLPVWKGKPKKQYINVGISDGMQMQVLSGLTKDEKILVSSPEEVSGAVVSSD